MSWLSEHRDIVLAVLRLVGIGLGAIMATDGLATMNEGSKNDQLRAVEAQASADVAKADKFGAFDNIRDYIVDVEKRAAGCDVALEMFDDRRKDHTAADWRVVMAKCHSK